MPAPKLSADAKRRRTNGSKLGAEQVKREFESVITRRRYCELVGIHATTLKKWEKLGVLKPALVPVLNSPTRVFTDDDVEFGKRLLGQLRSHAGLISVEQAAQEVQVKMA